MQFSVYRAVISTSCHRQEGADAWLLVYITQICRTGCGPYVHMCVFGYVACRAQASVLQLQPSWSCCLVPRVPVTDQVPRIAVAPSPRLLLQLLLRKAKALTLKGDYEEAEEQLAAVEALEGAGGLAAEVTAARTHNKQKQRAASQKQKGQFKSFFSS